MNALTALAAAAFALSHGEIPPARAAHTGARHHAAHGGLSGPGEDNPVYALYREAVPTALDIDLAEMGRRLAAVPLSYDPGEH